MILQTTDRYCPACGTDVAKPNFKRFGEWACSEAHAEEYVKEVRAEKLRVLPAARRDDRPPRQGCCG